MTRVLRAGRAVAALVVMALLAGCTGTPTERTSPCVGEDATALSFLAAPEAVTRRRGEDCLFTPVSGS